MTLSDWLFTKHFNQTRVRSVVTRSCCVSSMLRHGHKSRTSHSVHLTLGLFVNALIRWFLVAHICGLISKDTSSGRIRPRFLPSKSRWPKVLPKQAMAKDCRWNKLSNHMVVGAKLGKWGPKYRCLKIRNFGNFSVRFQLVLDCVWVMFLTAEVKGKFIRRRSDFLFSW